MNSYFIKKLFCILTGHEEFATAFPPSHTPRQGQTPSHQGAVFRLLVQFQKLPAGGSLALLRLQLSGELPASRRSGGGSLREGLADCFDHDPQLDIHFYISTGLHMFILLSNT